MTSKQSDVLADLPERLKKAVAHYWTTRQKQAAKQKAEGRTDQGSRGAATGGAQMDGIISLIREIIIAAGADPSTIFDSKSLELPGFFRPTKEWDLLVVKDGQLILAIESKSHIGSIGNNFNNRTEEAMGSALDLWTAYREGAFNKTVRPWLGYMLLVEESEQTTKPVRIYEPHFKVFPEFVNSSYARRYQLFCHKLVRERHYNAAAYLLSSPELGATGQYTEPSEELSFQMFVKSLVGQVVSFGRK